MNKTLILALVASLGYGLAGPIAKLGFNRGMSAEGFGLSYAAGIILLYAFSAYQKGFSGIFPTGATWFWGIMAGAICAVGFRAAADAMSTPGALISVVVALIAVYPIWSSLLGIPMFKEASSLHMTRFTLGIIMIVGGGYLLSVSTKVTSP